MSPFFSRTDTAIEFNRGASARKKGAHSTLTPSKKSLFFAISIGTLTRKNTQIAISSKDTEALFFS